MASGRILRAAGAGPVRRRGRGAPAAAIALALAAPAGGCRAPDAAAPAGGVVVERVEPGYGGARAGLLPGDVLTGWRRADGDGSAADGGFAPLAVPADFDLLELEDGQLVPIEVSLRRDGRRLTLVLPVAPWKVEVRPSPGAAGAAVAEARGPDDPGAAPEAARRAGDPRLELWARLRRATEHERANRGDQAATTWEEAVALAPAAGPLGASLLVRLGDARFRLTHTEAALASYERALALWEPLAPESAGLAATLIGLGKLARNRGEFEAGRLRMERALRVARRLDPDGPWVGFALSELGSLAYWRGDLGTAERRLSEAQAVFERLGIRDRSLGSLQMGLAGVLSDRGHVAAAEAHVQEAYRVFRERAPGSIWVAWSLQGLGLMAWQRGEWALAEGHYRGALAILDVQHPEGQDVALVHEKLGQLAFERGDLETARREFERALTIVERLFPEGKFPPRLRAQLGRVALEQSDLEAAGRLLVQADEQWRQRLPRGLEHAVGLHDLGEVALRQGRLDEAGRRFREALAIRSRLAPQTADEAASLHALGRLERQAGRPRAALDWYRRALEAIEAQAGRSGSTVESRARFRARHAGIYRELMELQLELGDSGAAFEALERYRAQGLRELVAERRLDLGRGLPPELRRERREIARRQEAIHERLATLDATEDHRAEVDRLVAELRALHQERRAVLARVQALAPRAAALEAVEPVRRSDLPALLPAGTVVLSYGVRAGRAVLFVADAGGRVTSFELAAGEDGLRERVVRLRLLLASVGPDGAGRRAMLDLAEELYRLLIAPAEPLLDEASRLVVLPDGVLHLLPFAALVRRGPEGGREYLAEWKPVVTAPSLDALRERRPAPAAGGPPAPARGDGAGIVVFGDPVVPVRTAGQADGAGGGSPARGAGLPPLPAARAEALAVSRLFERPRVHLGGDATEARAKTLGAGVPMVHFATHGVLDDRLPLDSALALTPSPAGAAPAEDGYLRAWEVLEQVRLDAPLVTLSACETALGEELPGEGLLGLTRAFHHAGARAVLASLWQVHDRATSALMVRFYHGLRAGRPADQALREAQLALIRGPVALPAAAEPAGPARLLAPLASLLGRPREPARHDFSHPHHWAAFQLYGDWR